MDGGNITTEDPGSEGMAATNKNNNMTNNHTNTNNNNNTSLSIRSNQGLLATTQLPMERRVSPPSSGNGSVGAYGEEPGDRPGSPPGADREELDFIGTGPAVKTLFSIPLAEGPVCVAVHNIDGTLLLDEVVPDQEHEAEGRSTRSGARLAPSRQSLAVALDPPSSSAPQNEALSLLSRYAQSLREEPPSDALYRHQHNLPPPPTEQQQQPPSFDAAPVREYTPWKFQDLNLLVGSDALVVRPPEPDAPGVVVRVEEVQYLQRMIDLQRQKQLLEEEGVAPAFSGTGAPPKSYAQALVPPEDPPAPQPPLNLDQVRLQTRIVPNTDPRGGWRPAPPSPVESTGAGPSSSPKCLVLDAYLDNLMANVPQLALCLQEKGLIRSVKLLDKHQIPSMMIHPNTLDTTRPVETVSSSQASPDLFSPEAMEANASALLRFLKANCTQNNTTYLLRTDHNGGGGGNNNIQLYDISSISQQRQKKWIWWLATMSYRFAMRLRQLETNDVLPVRRRAFRQRQRSLLQTTLDLLQDLLDMDGNAHESLVASVREHIADTFLGETPAEGPDETHGASGKKQHHHHPQQQQPPGRTTPPPVMSSSPPKSLSMGMPPTTTTTTAIGRPRSPPTTLAGDHHPQQASHSPVTRRLSSSRNHPPSNHSSHPPPAQPPPPPHHHSEQQQPHPKHQPYSGVSTDALNKAQDHLVLGIKALGPVLQDQIEPPPRTKQAGSRRRKRGQSGARFGEDDDDAPSPAMVSQLFGLNYKLVNVLLRLAEHYLRQYSSSSAMQALRQAARRMADSVALLEHTAHPTPWIRRLRLQYTWLWEHCGHFARSFASDELWRDRGHATGDDVLYVLRDAEAAFSNRRLPFGFSNLPDPLRAKTKGLVGLHSLSGVCGGKAAGKDSPLLERARQVLAGESLRQRDKRQVLVASCISYSRAIVAFHDTTESGNATADPSSPGEETILNLLRQRLGDACNETGKALLASVRTLLTNHNPVKPPGLADALLDSAHFWFLEGLDTFDACRDFPNIALLRCNLCQSWKLRANASFVSRATSEASHAEVCLEEAAGHLQAAHETLGQREVDCRTWDMVSEELAATFLVLAVRRRQSLLGGGNAPVVFEALRLSPGKERSIIEPMEKALAIYQQSGNYHQAAAVHYQLALTNSKVWTCQRDEAKTREKLSAAFQQYNQAFAYFSSHLGGNEPTFVLLCLDIASLYAAVSGEECLVKALTRCLDTHDAFSREAVDRTGHSREWLQKMETLAASVEDRVFKLLRSLVKLEADAETTDVGAKTRWKYLYREGLSAKMVRNVSETEISGPANELLALHDVLKALRAKFYA